LPEYGHQSYLSDRSSLVTGSIFSPVHADPKITLPRIRAQIAAESYFPPIGSLFFGLVPSLPFLLPPHTSSLPFVGGFARSSERVFETVAEMPQGLACICRRPVAPRFFHPLDGSANATQSFFAVFAFHEFGPSDRDSDGRFRPVSDEWDFTENIFNRCALAQELLSVYFSHVSIFEFFSFF